MPASGMFRVRQASKCSRFLIHTLGELPSTASRWKSTSIRGGPVDNSKYEFQFDSRLSKLSLGFYQLMEIKSLAFDKILVILLPLAQAHLYKLLNVIPMVNRVAAMLSL
jgi:hypothetical protein